jgi:peptidyl-prolyl cis-trans isomerase D
MEYEAHKLGLEISDKDVADYLRVNFPNLFPDGKFVGKDVYAAMLAQQSDMTIDQFEADLKRQMLVGKLHEVAIEGSVVTPQEVEKEFHKKNDQISLQYVKLAQDKFKKEVEPSNDEMMQYYKTNAATYQDPESKNLVILIADGAKLAANINPTDNELQVAYTQNQANFRSPEHVNVRHILLMTQGKPAADEAKIKAQADDLVKQLRAGANFVDMVKKYSEDPGSKDKGGEYDNVVKGQMDPNFEKAAFSQKPMAIGDPVKSAYGYHIIQVLTHEDARVKPFPEVKDDLAKAWKDARVSGMMEKISDQAQKALQKDPDHPEKVAADLGMDVVRADNIGPGQVVPAIGPSPEFDQAISGLKKGDVSQAVSPAANKVVIAEVTGVNPAHAAPFDEVKTKVHDAMVDFRLRKKVQDVAKQLSDTAKADGGDLAKAAKSLGLEVKTTELFKRGATVDGLGSANYFDDAFNDQIGTVLNPVPLPDATVVAKVAGRVDANMALLPATRGEIVESLKGDKARERNTIFEAGLVERLEKEGVVKLHPEVVERIISSFRSGS